MTPRGQSLRLILKNPDCQPNPLHSVSHHIMTEDERRELDKRNILAALAQSQGKIAGQDGAAALLGLKATTLRSRMQALGICSRHIFEPT